MAGNANVPRVRYASQRGTLGMRGTIGSGRNAVAYAYRSKGDGVYICPASSYTREPMSYGRERAIVRFRTRTSVGTGDVRTGHYDPWDGTRRILASAPYVGSEAWRRDQRERVRNAPTGHAHTCERERRDVERKCRCASFAGAPHTHRTDDGITLRGGATPCDRMHDGTVCAMCGANTQRYYRVLARIAERDAQ
jgi:hypothetical protein